MAALFTPGQVGMASGCHEELFPTFEGGMVEFQIVMRALLVAHCSGDWGDVDAHDKRVNDEAVKTGARIISSRTINDIEVWVITEAAQTENVRERQITTILRPSDY